MSAYFSPKRKKNNDSSHTTPSIVPQKSTPVSASLVNETDSNNNLPEEDYNSNEKSHEREVEVGIANESEVMEVANEKMAGVDLDFISCVGVNFTEVRGIVYPPGFNIITAYPMSIHSPSIQAQYKNSNFIPNITWKVDSDGIFKSLLCVQLIVRDKNNAKAIAETTSRKGNPACKLCVRLQYNHHLHNTLKRSASGDYGSMPDVLCPSVVISSRVENLRKKNDHHRLMDMNSNRKITRLVRKVDDRTRLLLLIQNDDIPALRRLLVVHLRNGYGLKSFIEKCTRAAEYKIVGHCHYQRKFIQRGTFTKKGSSYDPEAYKALLMTVLMNKLGCNRLTNTYSFVHGGLSHRQMQRHTSNSKGIIPNFKIQLTSCIDAHGLKAIEKNMEEIFKNKTIISFLPKHRVLTHLLVDGVAVEERLNVDNSQIPHQITGLCRHCMDTNFITFEDAIKIQTDLDRESTDAKKIHLAQEMEVFCIGLNDRNITSLFPVAAIPSCKKDAIIGESTNTVQQVFTTIVNKYHQMQLHKTLGPMSTADSDGAGQFRKGIGNVLNKDLPANVRSVYITPDGKALCPLLNLVGGPEGTTPACDIDHLGKRFRARVKTLTGIRIGVFTFTKVDMAALLQRALLVDTADEAERLFNPEDQMDVLEMVKCLYAIGRFASCPLINFPPDWRSIDCNRTTHRELRLLGHVSKSMCTMIIGHEGNIDEEGDHLSVGGYLTVCSRLAHLLFVLFRRNKTRFIPAQNYRNWQDTIKNMFVSVTLAKVNGVEDFWWFLNTNKRLEQLFGITRSMRGGNLNFDCLDLRDRLADSSIVQWIFSMYPQWDEPSRRLKTTIDRKNTRSWKGDTRVANANEVECWKIGREQSIAYLKESGIFSDDEVNFDYILSNEPGVDMLRPYRTRVGVRAGDRVEYTFADLDNELDDEEED